MGAYDGARENLYPLPFGDAMGKLKILNKAIGNLGGENELRKQKIESPMKQWNSNFEAFCWRNWYIRNPSDDEIGPLMT